MKTVTVQIGNTDHKLTQVQWSKFVEEVALVISKHCHQIHFFGGSAPWMPWQNVALVFECDENNLAALKDELVVTRKVYNQDSIAYMEGKTLLL